MAKIANMNFHYHRYPFEYFLDSTVRLGLPAVELWGGAPHLYVDDASHADIVSMRREMERRNLELVCFTPEQCIYPINLSSKDDTLRKRSIEYFKKCIGVTNTLETSLLLVTVGYGFYNEPSEEAWARGRESLRILAEEAEKQGVVLALEPMSKAGSNLITDLATLKRMYDEVNSPALKALMDTVPMTLGGDSIEAYGEAFGQDLAHIHFLDGDGKTSAHLGWGMGVFPLEAFAESLKKISYEGWLTLELIGPQYNWEPEAFTQRSIDRLSEVFGSIVAR
ncbi:TIM barrel protein [Cohnella sp. GbtcB17]|uniref:TIM barrel protein n=1 Tax=Cohnella sp. GbtcB17 TaxID=2824762 RepID=UPI001C30F427|nr:TIM barrel protein [Cohnella sp. GbtcB17]